MTNICSNPDCRKQHNLPSGYCPGCKRVYQRKWYAKNRDKVNGYQVRRRQKDPKHPLKARFYRIKYKYGLSPKDYDELIQKQNFNCAACGIGLKTLHQHQAHVDHCHSTGAIRGILCGSCNRALGLMKDDPIRLQKLTNYAKSITQPTTSSSNFRERKK